MPGGINFLKIWESWIGRWWTSVNKKSQDLALNEKEEIYDVGRGGEDSEVE